MWQLFWPLALWHFVLCYHATVGYCALLYDDLRLAAFTVPDFTTSFILRSNNGSDSFKEIQTGREQMPFHVRVYAKVLSGVNAGFCFEGVGSAQVSARKESHPLGGIVFAYDKSRVRIWAPSVFKGTGANGRIVLVSQGWGGKRYSQTCDEAIVVVEVWYIGPIPTFQANTLVDTENHNRVFVQLDHKLGQIPERVLVRVSPLTQDSRKPSPNQGFWFNAITASQNSQKKRYGGVIFAYDELRILLWAPSSSTKKTGCVFVKDGWGNEVHTEVATKCIVHIFAWVLKFPVPTFKTEWKLMTSQRSNGMTFLEINHMMNVLPVLVIVQGRTNKGLIFEATGATMSTENSTVGYGGILFAYDKKSVRIWLPKKSKGVGNGHSILVKKGWGGNVMLQKSNEVMVRVIIYTSNCDPQKETITQKGVCTSVQYNSYQWTTGPWGKCSSICNKGVNHREILACSVSRKETVLECGFGKDMCNWLSVPSLGWLRVKDSLLSSYENFGWNLPSDFYHAFAVTNDSERPVRLISPKFSPRHSCALTFQYKMFGIPPAILSVLVTQKDGKSEPSGWTMRDDQGVQYWRQGYVKLSKFPQLTQITFQFMVSPKSEPNILVTRGNVSIDDVSLICENQERTSVDKDICVQRKLPSSGCIHPATQPTIKGPAYNIVTAMNQQVYVRAQGKLDDLIATYDFQIHAGGEYSLWLLSYGTSRKDNDFRFEIDNLERLLWQTTYIDKGRPMWTQYMFQTFTLKPGVHTVYLYQFELNFKYSHLALTPKELLTWIPLGMQSRYIPDSSLMAYPPSSLPDPKFGRLNGYDAWCSSDHNPGYVRLEIALPELALISRIAVQGGHQIKRKTNRYWVTLFAIKVSADGEHFSYYRINHREKLFPGNSDSNSIVEHKLPIAVLAKKILIFPHHWENWICMRVELYGVYMMDNMCAAAGQETATTKDCQGDRNCSVNADCKPLTSDSIIKTGLHDSLASREACHCHNGYHGDSCQHIGCDPNPCRHGGKCQEWETNFTCTCEPGFHGSLCQWTCPAEKFGKNCAHTCLCGPHGSCNVATGHCSCDAGYYGIRCELRCPRRYFGVDCKQTCPCGNSEDCDHVTGACNCTAGWTGPFCDKPCLNGTWGVHCEKPCLCSKRALSCNPVNGECICPPGMTGETCDETCPFGTYGFDCLGVCRCSQFGRCDQRDGTCTCILSGWTGILCDQPCPQGYYGSECKSRCQCASNAECSLDPVGCRCGSGFSGPSCTVPCQSGRWGPDCKHSCYCKNNATCDSISGECLCESGWRGQLCGSKCPVGNWGPLCTNTCNCSNHGSCDPTSGKCECERGWTGAECNMSCPSGFYGPGCKYKCECHRSVECEPVTGKCVCPPGWFGRTCSQACPRGYFGKNCASKCSCLNGAACDHVLGTCLCPAGWTGSNCSQRCPESFFGPGCYSPCRCYHGHGKSCDVVTGQCQCGPGYVGSRCSQACEHGRYGQNCSEKCRCQNGAECLPTDGRCLCLAGFVGDLCQNQCPEMTFGVNCSQSCDFCVEGHVSSCDHVTGKCLCLPGYYGYHCENECPKGKYGDGCMLDCDCANGASCHHVTGTCECPEGFSGDNCQQPCPAGMFGSSCLGVCLCENDAPCSKVSGKCECLPGFTGTRCMDQCPDRRWGIQCRNKCSCEWNQTMRCRADTGQCLCHAGYRGESCRQFCDDGTFGQDCKHPCPVCSRHVTGPCYKIDGRCPCSPGYRGPVCDNDCKLKNFGKNCEERCKCDADHVCHHVNGACHPVNVGKFQIIIKENLTDFDDFQRRKQLKLHVAILISEYYDMYEELRHVSRRQAPSQSTLGYLNTTLTTLPQVKRTVQPATGHDFVARILDLSPGLTLDGSEDVVIVDMVIFDGQVMLNGSIVKNVILSIDEDVVSDIIENAYYSGELYSEKSHAQSGYVQLITSIAGALLLLVLLTFAAVVCRRRRRHLKKLKSEKKRQLEAEREMELRTRSFRHNGYRLAFDNPYYDVLAAMALDDDVEEDYINPLCDLDSLMSHQDSDATVSSATECSIQKGESLQSVSYC